MKELVQGGMNLTQQRLESVGGSLAITGFGIAWHLSDAARTAGSLFRGSLTGGGGGTSGFNTSYCNQLIDVVTCGILGRPGTHDFE
ncbi:MAG: hypothetical protein H0W42_04660 [Gemmatimonadaceae bacterium]|nr:hypothetical protein [Gemmatimonadaceae bacterium]